MRSRRVLVVEDDDLNRKLFSAILQMGHYKPLTAIDAETGLEIAKEQRPDLILMDIQLPGMDGLSATRLIKKDPDLKNIPVVALTAYAMPEDEQTALEAGCSGHISKPIDTRSFLEKVSSFMNGRASGEEKEEQFIHKKRILIVDDDPSNINLLRESLLLDKYEITAASNGEEALENVAQNPPDLIILDIMMPGMNGFEVTRQMRKNSETRAIPIILITGLDEEENKAKGLEAGADDFLNKPIKIIELRARVRSLLRLKEYRDQLTVHARVEKKVMTSPNMNKVKERSEDSPLLLLVEDDEKDAKLLSDALSELPYRIIWATDGFEALKRVRENRVEVMILDILLPNMDGYEVCRRIKNTKGTENIQVLMVTSLQDLESKIKGIELGADDYLVKPVNQYELKARVNALIRKKGYLDKLCRNYESAFSSAITDKLSGLYNRRYFDNFIDIELKRSLRQKSNLALLMIDIDDFKQYNDQFGHLEGDRILKELGEKIRSCIRETDLGVRYGGEEFVIVLPGMNQEGALKVSERIRQTIQEGFLEAGEQKDHKGLTVSMGVAIYPNDGNSPMDLIAAADRALYSAKGAGKDRVFAGSQGLM